MYREGGCQPNKQGIQKALRNNVRQKPQQTVGRRIAIAQQHLRNVVIPKQQRQQVLQPSFRQFSCGKNKYAKLRKTGVTYQVMGIHGNSNLGWKTVPPNVKVNNSTNPCHLMGWF